MKEEQPEIYIQDYRHFDNLIWQVPAWGSAVFSFASTSAFLALANSKSIEETTSIPVSLFVSIFLAGVFVIILLLINVFLRFRLHQRIIHRPNRIFVPSACFMIPGQTALLLVLFIEAALVLCFGLLAGGFKLPTAAIISGFFLIGGFSYIESFTRDLASELKQSRVQKS